MNAFDLFVLPSRREGFGLVLLEAMAASTPVVATRTSAIPEVVEDGQTGTLVPVEDASAMATAIQTVIESESREKTGIRGRERVAEKFSIKSMVQSTEKTYLDLLSR
jgi:glycosyltransferase involved in cell wall biosynthesis